MLKKFFVIALLTIGILFVGQVNDAQKVSADSYDVNDYYAYTSGGANYYIWHFENSVYGLSVNLKEIKNGKISDKIIYNFDSDGQYYSYSSDYKVNPNGVPMYFNEQMGLRTSLNTNAKKVWNIINSAEFKRSLK